MPTSAQWGEYAKSTAQALPNRNLPARITLGRDSLHHDLRGLPNPRPTWGRRPIRLAGRRPGILYCFGLSAPARMVQIMQQFSQAPQKRPPAPSSIATARGSTQINAIEPVKLTHLKVPEE